MILPSVRLTFVIHALVISLIAGISLADGPPTGRMNQIEDRIRQYEQELTREEKTDDYRLAVARLHLEKARLLGRRYIWGAFLADRIERNLAAAELHIEQLGKPLDGYQAPGKRELAYICPIDLSPEPFIVYVPTTYDPETPHPLLMFLHGYDYYIDKVNWTETMYSPAMEELAEEHGWLVAMPYGRSNTEFMGIGEQDVLNVLDLMKRFYNVDERRVVLSGASMGGSGAYTIAAHNPHLFAGVFSISHRMDFYLWMGVKREEFAPFKSIQVETDYVRHMLENFRHVPIFMFHGEFDRRPYPYVEQSRRMHALLGEKGFESRYHEFAGQGHYIWAQAFMHDELAPWMTELRSPEYPPRVTYRTLSLKYNRAYWVEIEEFERWGEQARVSAEVVGDNRIEIEANNIAKLILRPGELVEEGAEAQFVVNGQEFAGIAPDANGAYRLDLVPDEPGRPDLRKTPELCGPVRDAMNGPFLFVYGTAGDEQEQKASQGRAMTAAREWEQFAQGRATVKSDREITEECIERFNLILFGSPQTNEIVARISNGLPIGMEPDAYVFGDRRIQREGKGLMMIYPNPLNPLRYVVVRDGLEWGAELAINHRLNLVPDFIIYTEEIDRSGTEFDFLRDIVYTNCHVVAGYFDRDWQLCENLTWWGEYD